MERGQAWEEQATNALDVIKRAYMAELRIRELLLFHWDDEIKVYMDEVRRIDSWVHSTDPRLIDATDRLVTTRELEELIYEDSALISRASSLKESLDDTPVTDEDYQLVQECAQEMAVEDPPTTVFLDAVAEFRKTLDELCKIQRETHTADSKWGELDRTEQLKQLEKELLDVEALVKRPEFEKQLLEGKLQLTESCDAIKELHGTCYCMLGECSERLLLLALSLKAIMGYIKENWRQRERKESPTATATGCSPQQPEPTDPE